ncbi:hypothetical protein GWI33_014498 [Rhynchophorus ferrugineus]|uniref:Actin-interacting protein 1 n=1 Tax=Rhynchophorus ferrugineus TaxID=354439 RepID=A0A834MAL9_RHYFE|nr:hypothetical protein GWI33_014498 [Rhynchophorus ferrugineus]
MSYACKNIYATLPKTQRGQPLVLGGDPKGKNFLYTNGNSVIIRNIANPAISDVYTEHSCQVNVAKYSPSGFYIASGDQSGKVRIWDTVNKEHILKNEFHPFGGPIKDIAWSPDNQRMVVVGEGRERFGHVFMSETGTSVGEISGQSKPINSCDFRPTRPFRIVTGSEDNTIAVFEGPPFKFKMTKQEHSRFVQAVRYSPSGNLFASAGFDGKVFLYDGATSDLVGEVGSPAHAGGVYGVAWSPDETRQVVSEFKMGNAVEDQQVSCLWQNEYLLSVSLSGFINYLDVNNPEKPLRIVKGHNKPITVLTLSEDRDSIFTGSHDGVVTKWNTNTGENEKIDGAGHGNQINSMRVHDGNAYRPQDLKLGSQPRGMDILKEQNVIVVASVNEITVVKDNRKLSVLKVSYEPSGVSCSPRGHVAIGGSMDNKVHIYELDGDNLKLLQELDHLGPVTDVSFSPDDKYLVACDANRKVILYSTEDYKPATKQEWGFHNARVNCVAWSPDSLLVASGSLDTSIIIWSVEKPAKHIIIKNAHAQSQITKLSWVDNTTVVSVGQDCNTKLWTITPF